MPFRIPAHPGYRRCKELLRLRVPNKPIGASFTFDHPFSIVWARETVHYCSNYALVVVPARVSRKNSRM